MPRLDMTGTWAGEYWYSPGPAFPTLPPSTGFTLVARQFGCLGRFVGTVQDDRVGGLPLRGAPITGRVAGSRIRFWKQYSQFFVWVDDRLVTLGESLEPELEAELDEEPETEPILYRGEYLPDEGAAEGTWEVATFYRRCSCNGQTVDLVMPGYSGGWRMARQFG